MIASTLDACLWSASALAYRVRQDGPLTNPTDPYWLSAGFLEPPIGIVGDQSACNACLVGHTAAGLVVAFRGTLPIDDVTLPLVDRFGDWCADFQAGQIALPGLPGKVHMGFSRAVDVLWSGLVDELQQQLARFGNKPTVYFTGHSKGGAMAPLAAYQWHLLTGTWPICATFAAARPGSPEFAIEFNQLIPLTRYENRDDIVPHLPANDTLLNRLANFLPEQFHLGDYCPVGRLAYIGSNGQLQLPSSGGQAEAQLMQVRHQSLAERLIRGAIGEIIHEHTIWTGGGYQQAICPSATA